MNTFLDKLFKRIDEKKVPPLCVGLDPDLERLPESIPKTPDGVLEFLSTIIDATSDFAAAYKPNLAFFGTMGMAGWRTLEKTIEKAGESAPVILDAKFGDIGNTARAYARMAFEGLGADAATLNPLLGRDSVEPFLEREDRFSFILGITSNPGAADVEKLLLGDGRAVFERVIETFEERFTSANWGWVAGATQPGEMKSVRELSPDRWLLVPGVGAQGGSAQEALRIGRTPGGENRVLINVSRSVLYASSGDDFAEAARGAAEQISAEMKGFTPGS